MTKETILKRLLLENHITIEELITIVTEDLGKVVTINWDAVPKEDFATFKYNYLHYGQSPNTVTSKL